MNINFYDLFYTVIKNRHKEEIIKDQYENNENDYTDYNGFFIPNHNISIKPRETILGQRNLRSEINHFNKFLLYKR